MSHAKCIGICLVFLLLAACDERSITPDLKSKMSATSHLFNLTPRCVGRYLIDLPSNALPTGKAMVHEVEMTASPMTRTVYLAQIDRREAALKAVRSRYKYLYASRRDQDSDSHYFIHLGDPDEMSDANRIIEAYKWNQGYELKFQIQGSDWTDSIDRDEPVIKNDPVKSDIPEKLRLVLSLLRNVHGRSDQEIPTQPGMCFEGGFLPGPATEAERVETRFVLSGKPDVTFAVTTDSGERETDTLLQRGKNIEDALRHTTDGRTVRKGTVSLQGGKAEEWLSAGVTPLGVAGNVFILEGNSIAGGVRAPRLIVEARNGAIPSDIDWDQRPLKASLSEAEAVDLWDALSRTLRPRPNGF